MAITNRPETAETYKDYIEILKRKYKLRVLGDGAFGTVFQHPTLKNVAVKVYRQVKWMSATKWLEWCKKHPENPYVPKIYKVDSLQIEQEGYQRYLHNVVFMEKLSRVSSTFVDEVLQKTGASTHVLYKTVDEGRLVYEFYSDSRKNVRTLKDKKLAEVLLAIDQFGDQSDGTDLRYSNFLRRDQQLVFVDPVR
jgi:hypothetical protein